MIYAQVIVRSKTRVEELTYSAPAHIIPYLRVGSLVNVPIRKKISEGVVVSLKRTVPSEIKDKIRPIEKISKKVEGFSAERIAVIEGLAKSTGISLGEIASLALKLPEPISSEIRVLKTCQPIVWQATWSNRQSFYLALIKKHSQKHRLLFIFSTVLQARSFADDLGSQALLIDDNLMARKRLPETKQRVLIGTLSAAFFPLTSGDYLIVDQPNSLGLRYQSRPYLAMKTISLARSIHEGLQLVFGQTLISVPDIIKVKERKWRIFNKLNPTFGLTIADRGGSRDVLNSSIQEMISQTLKTGRVLIFSAYKGEIIDKISAYFPAVKAIEISSQTNLHPENARLVVGTDKILSCVEQRFDLIVLTDVERFLDSTDPEQPWKLLEIIYDLGEMSDNLIVQTYQIDHWVFSAVKGKLGSYYENELKERRRYQLPPFGAEMRLVCVADSEADLRQQSEGVAKELEEFTWIGQIGELVISKESPRYVFGTMSIFTSRIVGEKHKELIQGIIPPAWRLVTD